MWLRRNRSKVARWRTDRLNCVACTASRPCASPPIISKPCPPIFPLPRRSKHRTAFHIQSTVCRFRTSCSAMPISQKPSLPKASSFSDAPKLSLDDIKGKNMLVYETETQETRRVSVSDLKKRYIGKFLRHFSSRVSTLTSSQTSPRPHSNKL